MRTKTDLRAALCPVRDQGPLPTCLSHAVSTAHEHRRAEQTPLSADYLHYHATGGDWSRGSPVPRACATLKTKGQPREAACPPPGPAARAHWTPPAGLQSFRRISKEVQPKADVAKNLLAADQVPILVIGLSHGFYAPSDPWNIDPVGPAVAVHAVVGVAAGATSDDYILIRNSWGRSWGDDGHAWLGEEYLSKHLRQVLVLGEEAQ